MVSRWKHGAEDDGALVGAVVEDGPLLDWALVVGELVEVVMGGKKSLIRTVEPVSKSHACTEFWQKILTAMGRPTSASRKKPLEQRPPPQLSAKSGLEAIKPEQLP